MTHRTLARLTILAGLGLSAACGGGGGGTGTKTVGAPAALNTTATPTALANTDVTTPIVLTVVDANNVPVPNQAVTFAVTAGSGTLTGNATVTSDANGQVTAPTWKFGKSASLQTLTATLGSITKNVSGTVITNYNIDIRFFGRTMSAAEQAMFTAAAQRIMGAVTGDVPSILINQTISCGTTVALNETVDDIIIYASVDTIDGPGKILGQGGPCYVRNPGTHTTIIGAMQFDKDDFTPLLTAVYGQDVITHEMLHALGIGTLWELGPPFTPENHLVTGLGTADPRYTGSEGRQGCLGIGGTITCAASVPVEGNSEPVGTRDSHWRDHSPPSGFGAELMTGYVNNSANPFSQLSLRSLADLGYTVNTADFDTFTIPGGVIRAPFVAGEVFDLAAHERLIYPKFAMDRNGRITKIPERK